MYRFRKTLYDLKQAPRAWNKRICSFLVKACFIKCVSKHEVYVNDADRFVRIILCLYVDDLWIKGAYEAEIKRVKTKLVQEFEMSELGNFSYLLRTGFKDTREGVILHQNKYA